MLWMFLFFLGLIIGSFIGALTYRIPRGKSVVFGRSECPNCHKTISWYDNIPVLSYLILSGRCRNCHKKISLRYPVIELATAAVFVLSYLGHLSILSYLITPVLIAIFVIDLEHQIIPDSLVFLLFTIIFIIGYNSYSFYTNLFIGFLSSLLLLSLNLITRGRGMGLGDAKLVIPLTFLLGYPKAFYMFFWAFVIGAMVGIVLIATKKVSFGKPIPFGPFLIIGFFMASFI
ncbi:hypothetical protein A2627_00125 [Candidatus Woesebacteria bacterium RIFCSPHIGHO2_01_FULL_39_28]|uniref:Prepilin peptidase n=1 Tax=Candidatus Woesebacteria bacterium RIFCSPHIGHO2_01_FULL_39_28 TaxID=1802496 RepID=A0A1F7YCZ9_9BACT|nr:MAG: hypothetical protein A2627_00125 [Candidatus Woesebacteria bacterium RIFCSPHIGHO2_01_FULL_39_28]OGM57906.1 MAG: hypothetical protein A3A50_04555 [Candidatus Woesebacteria bacterium RIFCSPLOWO2_01_FULL_38_20]